MFTIRRAKVDDVATLTKLAKMVHFINLPPDRDIITQKIIHSRNSFLKLINAKARPEPEPTPSVISALAAAPPEKAPELALTGLGSSTIKSDLFIFVLEDSETGNCLGTSQVLAGMGGPGNPNVSFKLEERRFFSESLQTGTSHTVAKMHLDDSSPTEIGGLILQPSFRGHKMKLGRFLSLIRFHFIGLHRKVFADEILAEMMAPISPDGDNLLWDYLGRRFVPLSYDEADRFCQYSREFITSLLPKDDIYLSLLPPAARAVVGQVNPETAPARRMLERLGFEYRGFVDPFDGGPHLHAHTNDIELVKHTERRTLGPALTARQAEKASRHGIVSFHQSDGDFFAIDTPFSVTEAGAIKLPPNASERLHAREGDAIAVTPTDRNGPLPKKQARRRPASKKTTKAGTRKAARKTTTKKAAKR